jgi:hypothetical protein
MPGSLTFDDGTRGGRVLVRDLLGGRPVDITALCRREGGRITLPGAELAKIGTSMNPAGDDSQPGVLVEIC